MIKVLLVDDHELVRTGFRHILESAPDIMVMGEAGTGEEAIEHVSRDPPNVVLMDIVMPGIGGIEATCRIRRHHPSVKIIAVTVLADAPMPNQLKEAGAMGYLTKGCQADEMIKAIRVVARGERYISDEVSKNMSMAGFNGQDSDTLFGQLSPREMQVLMMVTDGRRTNEIADVLCVSPKTISTYRYRLYAKLGVETDVELTHLAMRYGILKRQP